MAQEAIVQPLTSLDELISANVIDQHVSRLRRRIARYCLGLRTVRGPGCLPETPVKA